MVDEADQAKGRRPVVILSTADFDSDVWTNKQHIAVRMAEHRPVWYIESLGLRRPTITLVDLRRIISKLRGGSPSRAARPRPAGLTIVSPTVIPLHGVAPVRAINRLLLRRTLRKLPEVYDLWSFPPVTYGIERRASRVVYHSVDLLHALPGVPTRYYLTAERSLLAVADHVIASSAGVEAHLRSSGRNDVLRWENVADTELFSAAQSSSRRPQAVFAGNLTPSKIVLELIAAVADAGIDVVVAGPRAIDGRDDPHIDRLLSHPRVNYVGVLEQSELAALVGQSMVGLIPYQVNDYTQGVFPMKVYEYLAGGVEVVSTPLPSLLSRDIWGLSIESDASSFVAAVRRAIDGFDEAGSRRRSESAAPHSWTARVADCERLLDAANEVLS